MTKQIQDAYIVAATRTPVGKAPRGMFRNVRPDDLLAHVLQSRDGAGAAASTRARSRTRSSAARCPRREQGMNVARIGVLLAGLPEHRRRRDRSTASAPRACRRWRSPPTASASAKPT